jgi:hypothetical protein
VATWLWSDQPFSAGELVGSVIGGGIGGAVGGALFKGAGIGLKAVGVGRPKRHRRAGGRRGGRDGRQLHDERRMLRGGDHRVDRPRRPRDADKGTFLFLDADKGTFLFLDTEPAIR